MLEQFKLLVHEDRFLVIAICWVLLLIWICFEITKEEINRAKLRNKNK